MIAALALGVVVLVLGAWCATRYFPEYGKHACGGEGAHRVQHLLAQAATEAASRGWHRQCEPVRPRGEMADDFADAETRVLPMIERELPVDHDDFARNPVTLQRVLAGLLRV